MTKSLIALFLALSLGLGLASPQAEELSRQDPQAADDAPIIVIKDMGHRNGLRLLTAVWQDGTVLTRIGGDGTELYVAQVDPESVVKALDAMAEAGFFEIKGGTFTAPDARTTTIRAKRGEESNAHGWNEWDSMLSSPVHEKWALMWLQSRAAVAGLSPSSATRLEDALDESSRFRGYGPNDSLSCRWLRG